MVADDQYTEPRQVNHPSMSCRTQVLQYMCLLHSQSLKPHHKKVYAAASIDFNYSRHSMCIGIRKPFDRTERKITESAFTIWKHQAKVEWNICRKHFSNNCNLNQHLSFFPPTEIITFAAKKTFLTQSECISHSNIRAISNLALNLQLKRVQCLGTSDFKSYCKNRVLWSA